MEVKIGHPESRSTYIDQKNKTESLKIVLLTILRVALKSNQEVNSSLAGVMA